MIVRALHFDAFATQPGKGNPAGVVLHADRLSDRTMQNVAKKIGFNETVFILTSTRADILFRYFTPGHEVDLCGHATIAAFIALCGASSLPEKNYPKRLQLETRAGILPILIDLQEANKPIITMSQALPRFIPFSGNRNALARILGITFHDIHPTLPLVYGSTGLWTLVVPITKLEAFSRMIPRTSEFPSVLAEIPEASIHPFCLETFDAKADIHARHFSSPRSGTVEDPVTGTASGVLGVYYSKFIVADNNNHSLLVEQGQETGRDGRVRVFVENQSEGFQVQIAGTGCFVKEFDINIEGRAKPVAAATATLRLPELTSNVRGASEG